MVKSTVTASREGIKIGAKKRGIGGSITFTSDNGIRVGIGIGILDLDYGADGTGRVGGWFGTYEMRVSRDGCNYVKDFYIQGIYTHTEYQRDENCEEDLPERDREEKEYLSEEEKENKEKLREKLREEKPIRLDPDRFPKNKIVLAVMGWRYQNFIEVSPIGGPYAWELFAQAFGEGSIDSEIPDFPSNVLDSWFPGFTFPYYPNPDKWKASCTIVNDGLLIGHEESINNDNISTAYHRGAWFTNQWINTVFGTISASSLPCFWFGSYGGLIEEVDWWTREYEEIRYNEDGVIISIPDGIWTRELIKIYFYNEPPRKLTPPLPPRKKMDCCERLDKRLKRIERVLATRELIDGNEKLKMPNHWFVPKGKGYKKAANYLEIANYQMRMTDHLSIHPFNIKIPDINPAKKGNQELKEYYPNATAWAKAITELLLENKSDSAIRLNLIIRIAIVSSKIFSTVIGIQKNAIGILHFLGAPLANKVAKIDFPFDITMGAREKIRGFERPTEQVIQREMQKHLEELNKLEEKNTEASLQYFLKDTEQPVTYETFNRSQPNLIQRILGHGKKTPLE